MKTRITYGSKIRALREQKGWTQEVLAEASELSSVRTIQRIEADETQGKESILAVAGALNVDLNELKTVQLIPESNLVRARLAATYREFVDIEEGNVCHASSRVITAPLTDEGRRVVERLLLEVFRDRECISFHDYDLMESYLEQIEEPLRDLFDRNFVFLVLDERKDLILPETADLHPIEPYTSWRVRHYILTLRHGCFRLGATELLHRFNPDCSEATSTLFKVVSGSEIPGIESYENAIAVIAHHEAARGDINWCDCCFPQLPNGSRLNMEYLESITGLTREKIELRMREETGDDSLLGLS